MGLDGKAIEGLVLALFLLEEHGQPPRAVPQATALLQRGLAGDLHGAERPGRSRQVLLVEAGDLERLGLKPGDLREQITVRLPGLMGLPAGARLDIGEAVLEISGPCEPCTRIGALVGRQDPETFRQALLGHRGVLARVAEVRGQGRVAVGDPVRLPAPLPRGGHG